MTLTKRCIFLPVMLSLILIRLGQYENYPTYALDSLKIGDLKGQLSESRDLCLNFLINKMRGVDGGFYSTYLESHPNSTVYGVNHEITSESTGLALAYAATSQDLKLFHEEFTFLERYQVGSLGVTYWKLNPDRTPFRNIGGSYSSALIDDLRILKALIKGYAIWRDEAYLDLARRMIGGVKNYMTTDGLLVDNVDWTPTDSRLKSTTVILGYIDFESLLKASEYDPSLIRSFDRSVEVVSNGRVGSTGLFYDLYNISSARYSNIGSGSSSALQILTSIHLVEAGLRDVAKPTYQFFRDAYLKDGAIYSNYDPYGGNHSVYELDIGAYSLASRLALLEGDLEFSLRVLTEKILPRQYRDSSSNLHGAFTSTWPEEYLDANIWDNFLAIHTIEEIIATINISEPLYSKTIFFLTIVAICAPTFAATYKLARRCKPTR
ncbi:MAG: hypothetical protein QXQ11_00925 [Candidatus Bathyarchaeia archaeon]